MKTKMLKKLLAAALVVALAIPAVYFGDAAEVKAAESDKILQVIAQSTQEACHTWAIKRMHLAEQVVLSAIQMQEIQMCKFL